MVESDIEASGPSPGPMLSRRRSLLVGAGALAAGGVGGLLTGSFTRDDDTIPTPAEPRARTVYVSSTGADSNHGRQPGSPFRSLGRALAALGSEPGTVVLQTGDTIDIVETVVVDVSMHQIAGERTILDATRVVGGGPAIRLTASSPQPLFQPWEVLKGFRLRGPGRETDSVGIDVRVELSEGRAAVAHIQMSNIAVEGFGRGVTIGDNAYCITLSNCMIGKCGICLLTEEDVHNSGERIELLASTIFDSEVGIDIRSRGAEVFAIGTSIDYCRVLVRAWEGRAHLIACHLEFNKSRDVVPLQVGGSTGGLVMTAGKLVAMSKSGPPATPYVISNESDPISSSIFRDVWMINLSTTTDFFATGDGHTVVHGETTEGAEHRSFTVLSRAANLLADGEFTQDQVLDDWFTTGSAAGRAAVGLDLEIDRADGTGALSVTRTISRGAELALAVPVAPGSVPRMMLRCRSEARDLSLRAQFDAVVMRPGADRRIVRYQSLGVVEDAPVGAAGEWTTLRSPLPVRRAASWTSHFLLRLDLSTLAVGETIWIRDVIVSAT